MPFPTRREMTPILAKLRAGEALSDAEMETALRVHRVAVESLWALGETYRIAWNAARQDLEKLERMREHRPRAHDGAHDGTHDGAHDIGRRRP